MIRDPIVEEVHRVREKMLDECGDDLDRLLELCRVTDPKLQERLVTMEMLEARRAAQPVQAAAGSTPLR
ncbi:MAG: hypothetical protein HZA46_24595 [Planctomycetales bacterium]|nr:hypothetical protein [Planctomycetales bacterium]